MAFNNNTNFNLDPFNDIIDYGFDELQDIERRDIENQCRAEKRVGFLSRYEEFEIDTSFTEMM